MPSGHASAEHGVGPGNHHCHHGTGKHTYQCVLHWQLQLHGGSLGQICLTYPPVCAVLRQVHLAVTLWPVTNISHRLCIAYGTADRCHCDLYDTSVPLPNAHSTTVLSLGLWVVGTLHMPKMLCFLILSLGLCCKHLACTLLYIVSAVTAANAIALATAFTVVNALC